MVSMFCIVISSSPMLCAFMKKRPGLSGIRNEMWPRVKSSWPWATSTLPATMSCSLIALCVARLAGPFARFVFTVLAIAPSPCLRAEQQNREFQGASSKKGGQRRSGAASFDRPSAVLTVRALISGPAIDLALGHLGRFLVGRLFLFQRLVEESRRVIAT